MIETENLHFSFGEKEVLRGVSFALRDQGLTALLGCNGAGKTTLFRCMLGLLPNYTGSIRVGGRELKSYTARELASCIAYIPQFNYPAFNYTVLDMVLMGTTPQVSLFSSPGEEQILLAKSAMEKLGIADLRDRGFTRLSGGEKQLVLIARALAQKAKILLMDEPCSALDFGNQNRVMQTVKRLAEEDYCVVMSTHHPQHALTYADRVIALSDGKILRDGSPDAVMDKPLMQTLYGLPVNFAETPYGRVIVPRSENDR